MCGRGKRQADIHLQTDRYRQTYTSKQTETNRCTRANIYIDGSPDEGAKYYRQKDRKINRLTEKHTDIQIAGQRERVTERETDRQTDRKIDR
jgi:hypothetical protein